MSTTDPTVMKTVTGKAIAIIGTLSTKENSLFT